MRNTPSLNDFPAWRWTSSAHAVLSPETLALIEPLTPEEASEIAAEALRRCTIESDAAQEFAADEQADATLRALPIPDEATVLISWNADTAVRTRWRVFREHWDDFCYAASDDVSIWAPGAQWSLCYFHYEVFILKRG